VQHEQQETLGKKEKEQGMKAWGDGIDCRHGVASTTAAVLHALSLSGVVDL
jgi:hypothetical protein